MSRRSFLKGASVAAASLAMPNLWTGSEADAHVLTGGGVRLTRFAHLTDLHFTTRPQNRYPTSHVHIRRAVEDLNHQDLDFVMLTGDLFHYPEDIEREMPALKDALKGLRHPFYVALGNHDTEGDRVARRKTFLRRHLNDAGLAAQDANYYTFAPLPGLRFIVLDSTDVDGDSYHVWTGHLGDRQARWLEETLAKHRDETIFIALHHPPIMPYPFMDKLRFAEADSHRLSTILARHPNVQMLLAGHYHFGGRNRFGNAELLIGPSLVEHPHCYRVIEVSQLEKGKGAVGYRWQNLNLHGDEDLACSHGAPAVRSFGLMSLSYLRDGVLPLALPG